MDNKYYIQRTGEKANDIWRFFQVVANLGVGNSEPQGINSGDVFVNNITFEVGTFIDGAFDYRPLIWNEYVYDPQTLTTYRYKGGSMPIVYDYEGVSVMSTENVSVLPDRKKPYVEDWKDEQGEDTYLSDSAYFTAKEVTIEFFIKNRDREELRSNVDTFLEYASDKGHVNYFDDLKGHGFRGYYKEQDLESEKYKNGLYWQQFNITFVVDKLCFGYDVSSCGALSLIINPELSGFYDAHLSNGDQVLNSNVDTYLPSGGVDFLILVPQFLNLVTFVCGLQNVIGVQSSGDFVIGVQSSGDFVIGV